MAWESISADDVVDQFTELERAAIDAAQGGVSTKLPGIVSKVIAQVRDDIRSGGYQLATDATTLPTGLHNDAIAVARWKFLITLPSSEDIQSKQRNAENEAALEKFKRIAASRYAVEPPTVEEGGSGAGFSRSGNWNSENKLIPRTHPIPRPNDQFPTSPGHYANDDAAADASS